MKAIALLILLILLSACDSSVGEFPEPSERVLTLESPSARDTLLVNSPFRIKGELDIEAKGIQIQVLSGPTIFLDQKLDNSQGLQPIPLDLEYTITTPTGAASPIEVGLRLSWEEGKKFVERPLYLQ